jgi:uncharacterized BrkB/YihY/UPF0761 family membrane protein
MKSKKQKNKTNWGIKIIGLVVYILLAVLVLLSIFYSVPPENADIIVILRWAVLTALALIGWVEAGKWVNNFFLDLIKRFEK